MVGRDVAASCEGVWLRRACVGGFFFVVVLVGVLTFRDYGVSWDEPDYYRYGELTSDFYAHGDRSFESFGNLSLYGPVVPLLQAGVADVVQPAPTDRIPLAHLVNYLIFVSGVAALYQLLVFQTRSWRWALLGAAFLVLSPRFFSHAFVNPKDSPFLALMTISMCLLVHYLESRRRWLLVLLGLATGLLVDIRVVGLVMVALAVGALALDARAEGSQRWLHRTLVPTWIFLGVLLPVVLVAWPYLWHDPIDRFGEALSTMSQFTGGPQRMFFRGQLVSILSPPRSYVPVWIAISTPTPYLALAGVGLVASLRRNPWRLYRERSRSRHHVLYAAWLLGPVLLVVIRGSAVYDEWRHLNFVYPALIIFAVAGAQACWGWLRPRLPGWRGPVIFGAALGACLGGVALSMVRLHPYEAVYFNWLAGGTGGASHQYEMDYWGLSYREGLEELLQRHPGETLDVYVCTLPGALSAQVLEDGSRLRYVTDPAQADFALCAPRAGDLATGADRAYLQEHPTVMTVRRDGAVLLWVKDLRAQ